MVVVAIALWTLSSTIDCNAFHCADKSEAPAKASGCTALRTFGAAKQVCVIPELYDSGTQPHLDTRSSNGSQVTRVDETEHQSELIAMARAQSG